MCGREKLPEVKIYLSDERLNEESDKDLRGLLEFYFSNEAKQIAGDWLRKNY
jgi:hypothetical protein